MSNIHLITSGNIGDTVATLLARQGHRVRLLVRQRSPLPALDALGVEQVAVDLNQPATLKPAFAGATAYFSVTPFAENLAQLGENAVRAAQEAGVTHLVRSSARRAAPDAPFRLGRWHGAVEQQVKESGLNYTILQPASFFQGFLGSAASIAGQNAFYGSGGSGKSAPIDTRDIAAAAATVLTQGTAHYGQTYDLTGSEALSNDEQAAILTEVLGRPINYVNQPPAQLRASMLQGQLPAWMTDAFLELDSIARDGLVAQVSPDFSHLTGQPARTFREFVAENRAAFQAPTQF